MGRIKTAMVRRVGLDLMREHPEVFKKDFQENKPLVETFLIIPSKKHRNIIAGYVTRLTKMQK